MDACFVNGLWSFCRNASSSRNASRCRNAFSLCRNTSSL